MSTEIPAHALRAAQRAARDGEWNTSPPTSLDEVMAGVQICRRCELWRAATQGVAGEGPVKAALMLVGEQPGDHEDLAGKPFVGPAGRVLDAGLERAGVARGEVYVTNAVKHFKHEAEPRGKRRLHRTPDAGEVGACRWWLDAERRLVHPKVVVALGATAALAVFGHAKPVGRSRAFDLGGKAKGVVTYHPSYLLRLEDEVAKKRAFAEFVADLTFAKGLAA